MEMAGKLVSKGVRPFENTPQRRILLAPRKLAAFGDVGEKTLKYLHLSDGAAHQE